MLLNGQPNFVWQPTPSFREEQTTPHQEMADCFIVLVTRHKIFDGIGFAWLTYLQYNISY
uniref:Uncharacterized protein n=1 Tax=Zea mays TaxID=4577 RepID=B4FXS1_MAIZE|nr:unknown [Zea mays]